MKERVVYLLGFIAIVMLLGGAFYIEKFDGINPCPLCVLQRIDMAFLGIFFFFGTTLTLQKSGRIIVSFFSLIISCLGIFLAGRQVWLQHLPANQNADCGVSLQYMMSVLPWHEVMKKVFQGTAECSQTGWSFLNVSLAEWTLVCFIGFTVLALWQVWRTVVTRTY